MKIKLTRIMRTAVALVIILGFLCLMGCDVQQATSANPGDSDVLKGTHAGGFINGSAVGKHNGSNIIWVQQVGKLKVFDSGIKMLAELSIDIGNLEAVENLAVVSKGRTVSVYKYDAGQISQLGTGVSLPGQYNINTLFIDGRKVIASLEHAGASWWVDIDTRVQFTLFSSRETYTFASHNGVLHGFGTVYPADGGPATGGIVRKWDSSNSYNYLGDVALPSGGIGGAITFADGQFGLLDPFKFVKLDLTKPTTPQILAQGSYVETCSDGVNYALSGGSVVVTPKQQYKIRARLTRGLHNIGSGQFIAVSDSGYIYNNLAY